MSSKRREVRLSRPGKVFVGLTLAFGFSAVNTGNNVLFLLVSIMLAIMVLSGFVAVGNLWRVRAVVLPGQIFTAGERGELLLRIHNPRPWPLWLLELRLGNVRRTVTRLGARQETLVALTWHPPLRGQPLLPPLRMGSAFPFAFVWRGMHLPIKSADQPWVAPAADEPSLLPADLDFQEAEGGEAGGSGDLLWVRERRPGEGLGAVVWRRVDWSLGVQGELRLPVREREHAGQRRILLDWEDVTLQRWPVEQRLQILRAALDIALERGWAWQLRMPGGIVSGRGRAGLDQALLLLAQQPPLPVLRATDQHAPLPWGLRTAGQWLRRLPHSGEVN